MKKYLSLRVMGIACAMLMAGSVVLVTACCERDIDRIVEKARYGDTAAIRQLAECYIAGDGVERNLLNASVLYGIYGDVGGVSEIELFLMLGNKNPVMQVNNCLEEIFNAIEDGFSVDSVKEKYKSCGMDNIELIERNLLQGTNDMDADYEAFLLKRRKKYPFINEILGIEYYKQMKSQDDILGMRKTVCYLKEADKYAMLSLKGAALLLKLYKQYGGKKLEAIDSCEEKRLIKLSTMRFDDVVDSVEVDSLWIEQQ